MTKISIVTVVFNDVRGLEKTYNSIATQLFTDYEWIVVDALSSDGASIFIESLRGHLCKQLLYIYEPDDGIFDGMNKGLRFATGDYVIFLNAGDVFFDNHSMKALAMMSGEMTCDVIYGHSAERDMHGSTLIKYAKPPHRVKYGMFTHHQAMLFKRTTIEEGYDLAYQISADYDLVVKLFVDGAVFCQTENVICIFERGGISQRSYLTALAEQREILRIRFSLGCAEIFVIYIINLIAHKVRTWSPGLFDRLRFKRQP